MDKMQEGSELVLSHMLLSVCVYFVAHLYVNIINTYDSSRLFIFNYPFTLIWNVIWQLDGAIG